MSMSGRTRSSQRGIHQARAPSSDITAGTRTIRITLASMRTAAAMPTASSHAGPRHNQAADLDRRDSPTGRRDTAGDLGHDRADHLTFVALRLLRGIPDLDDLEAIAGNPG